MKILLSFLVLSALAIGSALAGGLTNDRDTALIVGMKTNSIEGYGKFNVLKISGDTIVAVSVSEEVIPGTYLITSCSKNQFYHKTIWVIEPALAKLLQVKPEMELLAIVIGISDFQSYAKIGVTEYDSYLHASDPSRNFNPGTYLIVGTNQNDLYHRKLVIGE